MVRVSCRQSSPEERRTLIPAAGCCLPVCLLQVVAETADVVAVNKPYGMPVHTSGQYRKNTVQGVLQAERPELGDLLPVGGQPSAFLGREIVVHAFDCAWWAAEQARLHAPSHLAFHPYPHPYPCPCSSSRCTAWTSRCLACCSSLATPPRRTRCARRLRQAGASRLRVRALRPLLLLPALCSRKTFRCNAALCDAELGKRLS